MKELGKKQFLKRKKSDTVVIYGCGASLNNIDTDSFKDFDSIALNQFYKSKIPVTFYIVRDLCIIPGNVAHGETLEDFYKNINENYKDSCMVICKIDYYKAIGHTEIYKHEENLDKINGEGIVILDKKGWGRFSNDIFMNGIWHGANSLTNSIHLAVFLGYERIIFAGVDLYDHNYFWLPKGETREIIARTNSDVWDRHRIANRAIKRVKYLKKEHPEIKLYTANPISLLRGITPVWVKDGRYKLILAVDFDGTVVEHKFPEIGEEMEGALDTLRDLKKAGYGIIIWTCRGGKYLKAMFDWLNRNDFIPDAINENLHIAESQGKLKIIADIYIDDKNFNGFVGWDKIRERLL